MESGQAKNLYCNMNIERSLFTPICNSQSSILFVEGSPQEIDIKINNLLKLPTLQYYSSLRIRINGKVIHEQNTCCLLTTIFGASAILFPVFCFCSQWWRKKALKLVQVGVQTYQLISALLKRNNFEELYLMTQDNFLDKTKIDILRQGAKANVKNLVFINTARKFDTINNNSTNFEGNIYDLLNDIENAEFRWQKTVFTNSKIINRRL